LAKAQSAQAPLRAFTHPHFGGAQTCGLLIMYLQLRAVKISPTLNVKRNNIWGLFKILT